MQILTWNIQCGLGCDGKVDLSRIARVAAAMGDPDILCLQEVSRGFPPAGPDEDQVAVLAALFPAHRAVFGPAIENDDGQGRRRAFGNLVLSRLPLNRVERHLLPWPGDDVARSMRRQAIAVIAETALGPIEVVTTHLEFHSHAQRAAQVRRLLDLEAEDTARRERARRDAGTGPYASAPAPVGRVLLGDFNFGPADPLYDELVSDGAATAMEDGWLVANPGRPHAPTCGIFDHVQWPQGPHCRDFVFVSRSLRERIDGLAVDTATDASDHQPLILTLR